MYVPPVLSLNKSLLNWPEKAEGSNYIYGWRFSWIHSDLFWCRGKLSMAKFFGKTWLLLISEVKKFVKQTSSSSWVRPDLFWFRGNITHFALRWWILLPLVSKKGKKWTNFNPPDLPMINCVNINKKTDVPSLLNEIGVSQDFKVL